MTIISVFQKLIQNPNGYDENFKDLANIIADGVCVAGSTDEILYVSQVLVEMFGYESADQLIGKHLSDILYTTGPRQPLIPQFQDNLSSFEVIGIRQNGGTFLSTVTLQPASSPPGQEERFLLVFQDQACRDPHPTFAQRFNLAAEALRVTAVAIYSTLDFNQLLDQILEQISLVIPFDSASISLLDGEYFSLVAVRGFQRPEAIMGTRFLAQIAPGITAPNLTAMQTKKSILLRNVPQDYPFFVHPPEMTILSWMTIPLFTHDKAIGTLNLDSKQENHFTEEDTVLGELFAAQVSVALENARLYTEIKSRANEQTILNKIMRAVTAHLGLSDLLQTVDHQIMQFIQSPIFLIGFHDTETETWGVLYARDKSRQIPQNRSFPLSEGIPGHIIETNAPLYVSSVEAAQDFYLKTNRDFFKHIPESLIGAPLTSNDRIIGVMVCASLEPLYMFSRSDFDLFIMISKQTSIALQNALLYKEAEHNASIDLLTGIYNRRHFFELAACELTHAHAQNSPFSIIMIDLDNFKTINDSFGHAAGDQVLAVTTQLCKNHLRGCDLIGRYGGEEFIILLPDTTSAGAMIVAQKLRQKISEQPLPLPTSAGDMHITASFGVSTYQTGDTLHKITARADQAMYAAKKLGKNRVMLEKSG